MKLFTYYKQTYKASDSISYMIPTKLLKNGSYMGLMFTSFNGSYSGKPAIKSFRFFYPVPVEISADDIPARILTKLTDKLNTIKAN